MVPALVRIIIAISTNAHADDLVRPIGGLGSMGSGSRLSPRGGWGGGYAWLATELDHAIHIGSVLALESVNGPVGSRRDLGHCVLACDLGVGISRDTDAVPTQTVPRGALRIWYGFELESTPAIRSCFAGGLDARTALADGVDVTLGFEGR